MEAKMNMMDRVELSDEELYMVNGGSSLASKIGKWLYRKIFPDEKQQVYDPCNTCPEPVNVEDMLKDDVIVREGKPDEIRLVM